MSPEGEITSFSDLVAWVLDQREGLLHAHLVHHGHLVEFAPLCVTLRLAEEAPPHLAQQLETLLKKKTGQPWRILTTQTEEGAPTLYAQSQAQGAQRRQQLLNMPVCRLLLEAFPGSQLTFQE